MSSRHHKHENNNQVPAQHGMYMMPHMHMPNQRLAEATVPYQVYMNIWDPQTALKAGTIFPELYRPYQGRQ